MNTTLQPVAQSSGPPLTRTAGQLRVLQQRQRMGGDVLAENKAILERMKRRLEYMKNPRFASMFVCGCV